MTLIGRQMFKAAGLVAGAVAMMAATPAAANANANTTGSAATADVLQPVRDAKQDSLTTGDVKFRQLFASWRSLDEAGSDKPVEAPAISIPSQMPLQGAVLTSDYGMRTHPVLKRRARHHGVDLAAPTGTPVYATADGLVGQAERFSTYGLYIRLDHGANLETRYAHLSKLAVAEGETVRKGDIIGYVGSTGRSTGPHLHYEVRIDGVAVNPIPYMLETEAQQSFAQLTEDRRQFRGELTGQGGE